MSSLRQRRIRGLALAAGLAGAGLLALLAILSRPGETQDRIARLRAAGYPVNGSELDAWYVRPPDHENLATPLMEAMVGEFRFDRSDPDLPILGAFRTQPTHSPWPPRVLNAARETLRRDSIPLLRLHTALERPKFRYPVNLASGGPMFHHSTVRDAGNVLALEALVAAEENEPAKGVKSLLMAGHLADAMEGEPVLSAYFIAASIRRETLNAAETLLSRHELSPTNSLQLQELFLASAARTSPERGIAGEMAHFLDWTQSKGAPGPHGTLGTQRGAVLSLYWFLGLPQRDRRLGLRHFEELLAALRLPEDRRIAEACDVEDRLDQRLAHGLYPVASARLPVRMRIAETHATDLTRLRAAATACALERYRQSEGHLPGSMEALVPAFIASIPTDAFTGRPLRYDKLDRGFVVYRVGAEDEDPGGLPRARRSNSGERSFEDAFTVSR